jgi:hypothetical protein
LLIRNQQASSSSLLAGFLSGQKEIPGLKPGISLFSDI